MDPSSKIIYTWTLPPCTLPIQVKYTIEKLERVVQRRREESQDAQKRLEEFRDVLEVVKNTLANGAGALARKRTETANLSAQIEGKRANLEAARKKYRASRLKIDWGYQERVLRYCGSDHFSPNANRFIA